MSEELVIKLEEESHETTVETVEALTETTLETATEIADLIDTARQEATHEQEAIVYTLNDIHGLLFTVLGRLDEITGRLDSIQDELATLGALEVAELITTETPATVEEVVTVAEVIEEQTPAPEVPAPEPRVEKKTRKFI